MANSHLPTLHSQVNVKQVALSLWRDNALHQIPLDSPAWFDWLAQENSFRFVYRKVTGQQVNLTIRPEKRGRRTYWQAWKTIQGRTHKKYLAPTARLTRAKLDVVGEWFLALVEAKQTQDDSLLLYAALSDLRWLVERFVEYHPDSPLTERARVELRRIQRIVGD